MRCQNGLPTVAIGDSIINDNSIEDTLPDLMSENMLETGPIDPITIPTGHSVGDVRPNERASQPNVPNTVTPDIIVYEPHLSATSPNLELNSNQNVSNDNTQNSHAFTAVPQTMYHHPQIRHQTGGRCPYAHRNRLSSSYSVHPSNMRPAYAPHEMLWFRQQNNQEMLRRHYMNSINETTPSNSFGYIPNRSAGANATLANCIQCNQQHPIGHPHRRLTSHVCPLNLVTQLQSSENPPSLIGIR